MGLTPIPFAPNPPASASYAVQTAGDLTSASLPHEVLVLVEALRKKHGQITASRESGGLHLYMASPAVLEKEGSRELLKRHLSINVDRYFGFGKFRNRVGAYSQDASALCMKTHKTYKVSDLLRMPPLAERGYQEPAPGTASLHVKERKLVPDGRGNMIPEHPGTVIPVTQLEAGHPARVYLEQRKYDLSILEYQFRAGFCSLELPEDPTQDRWYRKMPGRFKDSPQGRLILFVDILGVQQGWQARTLDIKDDQYHWYWHPYDWRWVPVEQKVDNHWVLLPEFQPSNNRSWNPSKYLTARGAARNEIIMGFDAALAWNAAYRQNQPRLAILTEGPLDAGRFGPPGLAMLGKFLSENQARLIANHFDKIIYVKDNDAAGAQAAERVQLELGRYKPVTFAEVPKEFKDVGEILDRQVAWQLIAPYL